ncbi:MAG: hypothetical protein HYR49_04890 [Gammaproteobacteria bacterium]|nr:hypothetical protein [Gammaproteobacteria bacterium]
MDELRLILLAAGAALVAVIWLVELRRERLARRAGMILRRTDDSDDGDYPAGIAAGDSDADGRELSLPPIRPRPDWNDTGGARSTDPGAPDFIAIHVETAAQTTFAVPAVFAAAESAGLIHGSRRVFEMPGAGGSAPLFSMADMMKPGTLDRADATGRIRGLTLFMTLPAASDAAMVLDLMLRTAEVLAVSLGGKVHGPDHRPLDAAAIVALRRKAGAGEK